MCVFSVRVATCGPAMPDRVPAGVLQRSQRDAKIRQKGVSEEVLAPVASEGPFHVTFSVDLRTILERFLADCEHVVASKDLRSKILDLRS